jgi:hypothetical protein
MNKFEFVLNALQKVLDFFKGIKCKIGMCCGANCNSECSKGKGDMKDRWNGVKGLDGDKVE